jgi:GR25 family glycosyltransferase involved in LPS biosynthesis
VVSDSLIGDLGLLRLQDERRGQSKPVMQFGEFQLERYTKTPHCTMCYAITPTVAQRLLELHQSYRAPVDVVMKLVWTFDNPMYCLTPYAVKSSDLFLESMIGNRSKCSKQIRVRARRTWLKAKWQWRRLLFNLRQNDEPLRHRCAQSGQPTGHWSQLADRKDVMAVSGNDGHAS